MLFLFQIFTNFFDRELCFASVYFDKKILILIRKVIRCDAHIHTTYFSCSIRSHVIMLEHVRGSMLCTVSGRAYATFPPLPHISKKRVVFPPAGGLKNYCMTKKTVWSSWVKKNPLIFPELNSDKNKCHYHFITEFVQYWP